MKLWFGDLNLAGSKAKKHWHVGVDIYEEDGLDPKEVFRDLDGYLRKQYPGKKIESAPKRSHSDLAKPTRGI